MSAGKSTPCKAPLNYEDCQVAANSNPTLYEWNGDKRWNDQMPGCLKEVSSTYVYWNHDFEGVGLNAGLHPLCWSPRSLHKKLLSGSTQECLSKEEMELKNDEFEAK